MQHYKFRKKITRTFSLARVFRTGRGEMHLGDKIKEAGATGYILLWLLGIPIPILLIIFLLRGCT